MQKNNLRKKYQLTYRYFRFDSPLNGARGLYFFNIIRWQIQSFHLKFAKKESFSLPVVNQSEELKTDRDFFCLLGHGTVLIQLNGVRIITDPVFGDIPFYQRYTSIPYSVNELGRIDLALLSHNHYDHMDLPSLKKLRDIRHILLPLKSKRYIKKIFAKENMFELNWFDEFEYKGVKIVFLPAKHWCKRGVFDRNTSLWGSFLITNGVKTLYYAGDTAYYSHFKDFGESCRIDYAFLPIGAYKPDYIMKHNHMSPEHAYNAFKDLNAKHFIPVHYGVFKLSDEAVSEPFERIRKIIPESEIPKIGEVNFI